MKKDKLLTILIPTYNRAKQLNTLLDRMYKQGIQNITDVEILVSVNACSDDTMKLCKNYQKKIKNLRIKYFDDFVYSAEENISRSIKYCNGKYIFMLGDDDLIFLKTFLFMLLMIRNSDIPVLIFNHSVEDEWTRDDLNGDYVDNNFQFYKETEGEAFDYFLKKYGVITNMAFISKYVIRKDLIKDMQPFIDISRIYSHVFAFLKFFKNEKVIVMNLPLIARGKSEIKKCFKILSQETRANFYFPWTTGLLSHIDNAIKLDLISKSWFFEVQECDDDGRRFLLWQEVLIQMAKQYQIYFNTLDKKEKPLKNMIKLLKNLDYSKLPKFQINAINTVIKEFDDLNNIIYSKEVFDEKEMDVCLLKTHKILYIVQIKKIKNFKKVICILKYIYWENIIKNIQKLISKINYSEKIYEKIQRTNKRIIKLKIRSGNFE